MLQEILTYTIVVIAVIFTVYHIGCMFFSSKNTGGCAGGCHCETKRKFTAKPKSKKTL